MIKIIKELTGGSLSRTLLIKKDRKSVVRKTCPIDINREFGFFRLFNQYKRLERYNKILPGLFPEVIDAGYDDQVFYLDLKYYDNLYAADKFLLSCSKDEACTILGNILDKIFARMYSVKFDMFDGLIDLYVKEKIIRKIKLVAEADRVFSRFLTYDHVEINGAKHRHYIPLLEEILCSAKELVTPKKQCLVHGNLTIENIICNKSNFLLLDPYVENIFDSHYIEISQLFQSLHSQYEFLKRRDGVNFSVDANRVRLNFKNNERFSLLYDFIVKYLSSIDKDLVRLAIFYESTQFIRMLPFKLKIDPGSVLMFYTVAIQRLEEFRRML